MMCGIIVLPGLEWPVEEVPGLRRGQVETILGEDHLGDDGAQAGVGQAEHQAAQHDVPHSDTAPDENITYSEQTS